MTDYGNKRTIVGAHYGMRDWLSQRVTAVLMFAAQWMKFLTFVVILALAYHAWVGMRNIWMDYIKPVGLRLVLEVFTIVWLLGCVGWGTQVLWRL